MSEFHASLQRIAEHGRSGTLGYDGGWLATAIELHLAGAMPLHAAMRAAWSTACRSRRDHALRSFARLYPAGISAWAAASQTATELRRYVSGSWPRDRNRAEMPTYYHGTPAEMLYRACRASADAGERGMPTSGKQLARILGHDPRLPMSKGTTAECYGQELNEHAGENVYIPSQRRGRRS